MHISLDGYAAGPNGEMDWIVVDQDIFDHGAERILATDTALYGRKTYEMMEAYWPMAADLPNASKHDIQHSAWYRDAKKVVISTSLQSTDQKTLILGGDLLTQLQEIKLNTDQDILLFGSPSTAHALFALGLIEKTWINISPVLLGAGIRAFEGIEDRLRLKLVDTHVFDSGVVYLSHEVVS